MANYVEMWKDLGMDLENHDLLCQVLPTAVGDVFLTQENRPNGMDFWDLVISEVHGIRPAELIEAQKNGTLEECWGTGTAAVISPVGKLRYQDEVLTIQDGATGPLSLKLYETITGIQTGVLPDENGWRVKVGK